jgi:hypothetical protein
MRSIGDELRKSLHRGFQTRQHGVQNVRQPRQFVACSGNGQTSRKILDADGQRRRSDVRYRFQRASAEPRSTKASDPDDNRAETEQQKTQKVQRVLNTFGGIRYFQIKRFICDGECFMEDPIAGCGRHLGRIVEGKCRTAHIDVAQGGQGLAEFLQLIAKLFVGCFERFRAEVSFKAAGPPREILVYFVEKTMPERQPDQAAEQRETRGQNHRVPDGQPEANRPVHGSLIM